MDHREIVFALTARRKAQGLTRRDVSRKAGVALCSVSVWESGRHVPRVPELILWAGALGCELTLRERA